MENASPLRAVLGQVLLIVFVFFSYFLCRSVISPLLLTIEDALGINHTTASRSLVYLTAGYSVSIVLSGVVSARLVYRKTIVAGGVVIVVGTLLAAVATSVGVFRLGLTIIGIGSGVLSPATIAIITALVVQEDWSRALAVNELSPHLGMILAPLLVAATSSFLPWRLVFFVAAGVLALALFFFARFVKGGDEYGSAPSVRALTALAKKPAFWLLGLLFALSLAGTDGVYFLIPTFLATEGGMDPATANAVFGLSRFVPIAALTSSAFVFHRLGTRRMIVIGLAGSGLAVVLIGAAGGFAGGAVRLVSIFLQPAVGALFFPAGFAALSALSPPEERNVGISMVLPVGVLVGVGVIPSFLGYMGDAWSFSAGFVFIGTAMIAASLLSFLFPVDGEKT